LEIQTILIFDRVNLVNIINLLVVSKSGLAVAKTVRTS